MALISVVESALACLKSFETHRLEPATPNPIASTTPDRISAIVPNRIEKPRPFVVAAPGIPLFIDSLRPQMTTHVRLLRTRLHQLAGGAWAGAIPACGTATG